MFYYEEVRVKHSGLEGISSVHGVVRTSSRSYKALGSCEQAVCQVPPTGSVSKLLSSTDIVSHYPLYRPRTSLASFMAKKSKPSTSEEPVSGDRQITSSELAETATFPCVQCFQGGVGHECSYVKGRKGCEQCREDRVRCSARSGKHACPIPSFAYSRRS